MLQGLKFSLAGQKFNFAMSGRQSLWPTVVSRRCRTGGGWRHGGAALLIAAAVTYGGSTVWGNSNPNALFYDQIGLPQLEQVAPNINGSGVSVATIEAMVGPGEYEVNPTSSSVNQSPSKFTFMDESGTVSSSYDSADYSSHANLVATVFYGNGSYSDGSHSGVAPGVSQIYNLEADGYINYYIFSSQAASTPAGTPAAVSPLIVNQSYIDPGVSTSYFDSNASTYNTLYVSSIGDGTTTGSSYINAPSTMYNGLAVAAYSGTETNGVFSPTSGASAAWVGPTTDGRSKPDITAPGPGPYTSFTTPMVSGVAALIAQAGMDGFGGTGTQPDATDIRTIKALLLNGASKPQGWTNNYTVTVSGGVNTETYLAPTATTQTPLDPRYGSGVVNAYNSYENLVAGEHGYSAETSQAQAPFSGPTFSFDGSYTTPESTLEGWNKASIASSATTDGVDHYIFDLGGSSKTTYTLTATLVWNLNTGATGINNLDLALVNAAGTIVGLSDSSIDNVQQLYLGGLSAGLYDLQVLKVGSTSEASANDTYALAYNWVPVPEPSAGMLLVLGAGLMLLTPATRREKGEGRE